MSALEFPEFNPDIEPNSVGVRWLEYKDRFENFMIAKHGKELSEIADSVCKASLLHYAGQSVYKMYKTKEESKHKYTDMIRVLDEFFVPQSKIIQGCLSDQLRQRALSDKNMTLDRLIEEGRAMEASRLQAKQMEGGHEVVAAIGSKKSQRTIFNSTKQTSWKNIRCG
ncbi:hypothetical protein BpHYR1_045325 [Brachionus plicatilis]|uniref:Uncharacterized protein n=1 Tax=Brachionus plicatilis TaxID=10195 RepID=A0A3M7S5U6_BRAPC|nr:hypothetical protein BpHYR1_045325 [Brachionus plicatilis]